MPFIVTSPDPFGAAPVFKLRSCVQSRRAIGSCVMLRLFNVVCCSAFTAFTSGTSAWTVMVLLTEPSSRARASFTFWPAESTRPSRASERNPVALTSRRYVPAGTTGKLNSPVEFDCVLSLAPVAVFSSDAWAFATVAPLGSVTVPYTVAVFTWAEAAKLNRRTLRETRARGRDINHPRMDLVCAGSENLSR